MKNQSIKKLIFLLFISLNAIAQDGKFSFKIPSPITTSAGVFKDDSILIKTLWNNEKYASGTYTKYWDGTDDLGNKITSPAAVYKIKVMSNNVQYTWQGTIGNTSDNMTGESKYKGYTSLKGLAFGNTYGYFCTGYSEGFSSLGKFNISTPNTKIPFFSHESITGEVNYVTADGVNVYWATCDSYSSNNTFVFGTKISDDYESAFSSGSPYAVTYGKKYSSVISKVNATNSNITGLAVQKNGICLFVARAGMNQLQVLNKTTGALIQNLTYTNPKALSIDANDNLWMVTGSNTVGRYPINSNGTLDAVAITLVGLLEPLATQVSTDGSLIVVADGSTSQQVKFFNNLTGVLTNTLGTAGGYFYDVNVNDNKFYFSDIRKNQLPFVSFQSDGSFWVNDPGNFRTQHYNSNHSFINKIMFLGTTYSINIDKNNINRSFAGYLEFALDYSVQNLTGTKGWALVKNWGSNVPSTYNDFTRIKYPVTLSNGRTYAAIEIETNMEIVELTATGKIRFTGILFSIVSYNSHLLCSDGSLQVYTETRPSATYKRYALTGFDGAGNPVWSTTPEILAVGTLDDFSPAAVGNPIVTPKSEIFSNSTNKVVLFNYKAYSNNSGPVYATGYHLGLMQKGASNNYLFQTEKSTHRNYAGPYPPPGWFDVGNQVSDFAGGNVNVIDRNIITSYHGEFWKLSQTNKYNHYYDNGLAIGQFGTTRPETSGASAPMMAGNSLEPTLVKDGSGDLYLYHGDESDHSGIHRWKITKLSTIAEQVLTISYPSAFKSQSVNYIDLMAGLPFDATLVNNTAGWTRNPALNDEINYSTTLWRVRTGVLSYDTKKSTDLSFEFTQGTAQNFNVSRDLGNDQVNISWKITGKANFGNMLNGLGNNAFMEVLDVNGKVLTTMYALKDYVNPVRLFGNTLFVNESSLSVNLSGTNVFEISVKNGAVTFSYGNYTFPTTTISDSTGNWTKPKTLRFKFSSNPGMPNFGITFNASDLKLYKDDSVVAPINVAPVANAGTDKTILLPVNNITLSGSGSDVDGTIFSYAWTKISGPSSGTIATANTAATAINSLVQGVYKYELTVTDNNGATAKDTVQVTVNAAANINQLPSAKAGADLNIVLPTNYVLLNGGGSDQDGTIISYSWKVINGPAGYSLNSPQLSNTKIENLFQGIYNAELTVKDNDGAMARDTLTITVSSPRLSNYAANAFTVYPNPVKDIANLNIETINGKTKLSVSVADVGGRLLKYQEMVTSYNDTLIAMDLSNLSNSYYIITVRFDDGKKISSTIIKSGGK